MNHYRHFILNSLLAAILIIALNSQAQVPQMINYQGRVAVGTVNFDGSGQFKFALVNASGSTTYWSNNGSSTAGSQPTAAVTLTVVKGLYSVLLGDATLTNMTIVPATVFTNADVRLRVWFNDGVNGFQLLSPDQRIAAVGYALMANSVADDAVSTTKIANGAVTSAKLATNLSLSGTTTGSFNGPLTGNVTGSAASFTGSLGGDVTGTQSATVIPPTVVTGKLLTTFSSTTGTITTADSIVSAINKLNGNVGLRAPLASPTFTGVVSAPIFSGDLSGIANGFSGPLAGNVSGSMNSTVVNTVGGVSAANVAAGANLANAATSTWTTSTIVKRDSDGNFAGGRISANQLELGTAPGAGIGNITLGGERFIYAPGSLNIYAGQNSGAFIPFGSKNTAIGAESLSSNTASNNVAVGYRALRANQAGTPNTAVGSEALDSNSGGGNNTAVGHLALWRNDASNNTAVGESALQQNTSGTQNVAVGVSAMGANISANNNTAVGRTAMEMNTIGSSNTAVGERALRANISGGSNAAFGNAALLNCTGSSNTAIGQGAGSLLTTGSNNIVINASGVAGESNAIRIGTVGTQTATFIAGINGATAASGAAIYVSSSGQLGTLTSSRRFKQNIKDMNTASESILSLRPVTFEYKTDIDPLGVPQFGLIAEGVAEVNPSLVVRDDKGVIYTVRYEQVNAMLLNEFLKDHRRADAKDMEIAELKKRLAEVEAKVKRADEVMKHIANLKQKDKEREARLAKLEQFIPAAPKSGVTTAVNLKAY